jgi:hypothetical protein
VPDLAAAAIVRMLYTSTRHLKNDSRAREKRKRNKVRSEPPAGGTWFCRHFRNPRNPLPTDQRGRATNNCQVAGVAT